MWCSDVFIVKIINRKLYLLQQYSNIKQTRYEEGYEAPLFKGTLSGLRQFLATASPLKMKKNAFYLTSKTLFVIKIFKFLSWLFSHVSKQLD